MSDVAYAFEFDYEKAKKVLNGKACEREDLHTPAPSGYLEWHDWAERKAKTHDQRRCPGCTLLAIWVPKRN